MKRAKRNLIIDVGAGNGGFSNALRNKYPQKEVLPIDAETTARGVLRKSMGELFSGMSEEDAQRVHSVHLHHVNIRTTAGHKELLEAVKRIPLNTPLILTVRNENLTPTINSLQDAGLTIIGKRAYNPKMLGSPTTKRFYEDSARDPQKAPIRLIAIKRTKK